MEALLLGIYSFFVWLIFFKFKWLPWNATAQVIVVTIPIIGRAGLNAFDEVEAALAANANLAEREPILAQQLALGQHALQLEQVRYQIGASDLRTVLQQQMATYSAQTALIRVQAERRVQRVNLYVALGGDFGVARAVATTP